MLIICLTFNSVVVLRKGYEVSPEITKIILLVFEFWISVLNQIKKLWRKFLQEEKNRNRILKDQIQIKKKSYFTYIPNITPDAKTTYVQNFLSTEFFYFPIRIGLWLNLFKIWLVEFCFNILEHFDSPDVNRIIFVAILVKKKGPRNWGSSV